MKYKLGRIMQDPSSDSDRRYREVHLSDDTVEYMELRSDDTPVIKNYNGEPAYIFSDGYGNNRRPVPARELDLSGSAPLQGVVSVPSSSGRVKSRAKGAAMQIISPPDAQMSLPRAFVKFLGAEGFSYWKKFRLLAATGTLTMSAAAQVVMSTDNFWAPVVGEADDYFIFPTGALGTIALIVVYRRVDKYRRGLL